MRGDARRRAVHRPRRAEGLHPRGNPVRLVRAAGEEDPRERTGQGRHRGLARPVRALRAQPPGAVRGRAGARADLLRARSSRASARGRGCDICKPAVGSILASQHGAYILDAGPRRPAGHQRPRPGEHAEGRHLLGGPAHPRRRDHPGEARRDRRRSPTDFGLYTKITGGQRIDLFGARLEQLPEIWKRPRRRRLRVRPGLRQVAAQREDLRRLDLVPLRRAGLGGHGDQPRAALPRACARRTSSSSASPAARASARRPAARTSA